MKRDNRSERMHILLVEDDPGDRELTLEAFRQEQVANQLHMVCDGEQAMAFLRREGCFAKAPQPGLILLDLNLPRMDGREVLAHLKRDPKLKSIPVIVLSTSDSEADIVGSYELNANAFITKPQGFHGFLDIVRVLMNFWFAIAQLPMAPGMRTLTSEGNAWGGADSLT